MESNRQSRNGEHRGHVRDPENDGRLRENREAGHTKGTTSSSEARAHEHGREPDRGEDRRSASEHSRSASHGQSHTQTSHRGSDRSHEGSRRDDDRRERDDLKSREYRDEQGEIHHHTRTYTEQHGKK